MMTIRKRFLCSLLFFSFFCGGIGLAGEGSGAGPIEHTDFQLPQGLGAVISNPKYVSALNAARAALPAGYQLYLNDGTVYPAPDGTATVVMKVYRNIPLSGCIAKYHGLIASMPVGEGLDITFFPTSGGNSGCRH